MALQTFRAPTLAMLMVAGLAACGGDSDNDSAAGSANDVFDDIDVPETYAFETGLDGHTGSSVSYSGQVARHVLIEGLNAEINTGLQAKIDDNTWDASTPRQTILDELEVFFDDGTDTLAGNTIEVPAFPGNTEEQQYSDLSGGKNLVGKLAGNDDVTDHKDWDNGGFVGWNIASPELLVRDWFDTIVDNVQTELNGTNRQVDFSASGSGTHPLEVYHTDDGLDLKQLVQKFLLGAVTMSQAMDDYLDDDEAGKGLLTDNTSSDEGAAFTALEHQFDEGFGYFGAARNYLDYTDEEIAGKGGRVEFENGYNDFDGSGTIDLDSEFNFGNSTNAAKRDLGSTTGTDFTTEAFEAFLKGRAIINFAVGRDLTTAEMDALKAQRDIIVEVWEKAIAATVVHYINDTLGDMDNFGSAVDYSYADHTKHFGELKGFALGLQFNPRSPLHEDNDEDGTTDFEQFHDLVGERPVLPNATAGEISDYEQALLDARALLQTAYGFAQNDVENW